MWWIAAAMAVEVVASGDRLEAPPVAFDTGKATLTADSAGVIEAVAALMAARPELIVRIEVHTDAQGSDVFNLKMSQDRADTIRAALVARGIAPERLVAQGWGEYEPIADGRTAEGRASNRRVEWWTDPTTETPPALPVVQTTVTTVQAAPQAGLGVSREAWCGSLAGALELVVTQPSAVKIAGGRCTAEGGAVACAWPAGTEKELRDALAACLPSGSPAVDVSVAGSTLVLRPR